jgi:hypothetical protein
MCHGNRKKLVMLKWGRKEDGAMRNREGGGSDEEGQEEGARRDKEGGGRGEERQGRRRKGRVGAGKE